MRNHFLERLLSFLYQVSRRGHESTRVQICHQTYIVTVVHQSLLCHHCPYIFPGIQLQDVFSDDIMTILGKSGVLTMLSIFNGHRGMYEFNCKLKAKLSGLILEYCIFTCSFVISTDIKFSINNTSI